MPDNEISVPLPSSIQCIRLESDGHFEPLWDGEPELRGWEEGGEVVSYQFSRGGRRTEMRERGRKGYFGHFQKFERIFFF